MGFIEKRSSGYWARHRDPLGRLTSKTFRRKADAERWVREMEVDLQRGEWLDPRSAQVRLANWAEDFLALARRLSPTTQATYRRDLANSTCASAVARPSSATSSPRSSSTRSTLCRVPILLGRGVRLWDGIEGVEERYEIEVVSSPSGVTHLTFTRR